MKSTTFFLISKVLCFRLKKQTSKNVADTTFKEEVSKREPKNRSKYLREWRPFIGDIF